MQHTDTGSDTEVKNILLLSSLEPFQPIIPENITCTSDSPANITEGLKNKSDIISDKLSDISSQTNNTALDIINSSHNEQTLANSLENDVFLDCKDNVSLGSTPEKNDNFKDVKKSRPSSRNKNKSVKSSGRNTPIVTETNGKSRDSSGRSTPVKPKRSSRDSSGRNTPVKPKRSSSRNGRTTPSTDKKINKSANNSSASTPTGTKNSTPAQSKNNSGRTTPITSHTPNSNSADNSGTNTPIKRGNAIQNFIRQNSFDQKKPSPYIKPDDTPLLIIKRTPSKINLPKEPKLVNKPRITPLQNIKNAQKYFGMDNQKPESRRSSLIKIEKPKVVETPQPKEEKVENLLTKSQHPSFDFEPQEADIEGIDDYIENLLASEDKLMIPILPPTADGEEQIEPLSESIEDLLKALEVETGLKDTSEDVYLPPDIGSEKLDDLLNWMSDLEHQPKEQKLFRSYSAVKYKNLEDSLRTPKRSDSLVSKIPKDNISFFEKQFALIRKRKDESLEDVSTENNFIKLSKSKTDGNCNKQKIPADLSDIKVDVKSVLSKFEKPDTQHIALKKRNSFTTVTPISRSVENKNSSELMVKDKQFDEMQNMGYNSIVTVQYNLNNNFQNPENYYDENIDSNNLHSEENLERDLPRTCEDFSNKEIDNNGSVLNKSVPLSTNEHIDKSTALQDSISDMATGLSDLLNVVENSSHKNIEENLEQIYNESLNSLDSSEFSRNCSHSPSLEKHTKQNHLNIEHHKENKDDNSVILQNEHLYDNILNVTTKDSDSFKEPVLAMRNKALKTNYFQDDFSALDAVPVAPRRTRNLSASLENIANMKIPPEKLEKNRSLERLQNLAQSEDSLSSQSLSSGSNHSFDETKSDRPVVPTRKRSNNSAHSNKLTSAKPTLEIKPELPPRKRTSSYAIRHQAKPDSPGVTNENCIREAIEAKPKSRKHKDKDCVIQ